MRQSKFAVLRFVVLGFAGLAVAGTAAADAPLKPSLRKSEARQTRTVEGALDDTSWSGSWSRHGRSATHPIQVSFADGAATYNVTTADGGTHTFQAPYRITAEDRVRVESNPLDRVDVYTIRPGGPLRMTGSYTYQGAAWGAVELHMAAGADDAERMAALQELAQQPPSRTISFLSPEQIRERLVGNTTIYQNNHAIYYAPDGTLIRTSPAGVRNGTWNLVNDRLCEQIDLRRLDGCYKITVTKDGTLAYYKGAKIARRATVHAGRTREIAGKRQ